MFCHSGLESVVFPSTLEVVGKDAFSGCEKLKTVTFSEGLKRVGRYAFAGCAIEVVAFPSSLEEVQERAFFDNPLRQVTFCGGSRLRVVGDCVFGRDDGGDRLRREDVAFPAGAQVSSAAFGHSYFSSSWQ